MIQRGTFIVFEGIDGSGKTIHLKEISKKLIENGYQILNTREPSKGKVGIILRDYIYQRNYRLPSESEALLFAADRRDHTKNVIRPALKRGKIVLSDRYYFSSLAYQGAAGVDNNWIKEMNRFALKPDLAVLLDILPEYSLHRLKRRRSIYEDSDYLRKVREIYIKLVNKGELVKVDADRPKRVVQGELLSMIQDLVERRNARPGP